MATAAAGGLVGHHRLCLLSLLLLDYSVPLQLPPPLLLPSSSGFDGGGARNTPLQPSGRALARASNQRGEETRCIVFSPSREGLSEVFSKKRKKVGGSVGQAFFHAAAVFHFPPSSSNLQHSFLSLRVLGSSVFSLLRPSDTHTHTHNTPCSRPRSRPALPRRRAAAQCASASRRPLRRPDTLSLRRPAAASPRWPPRVRFFFFVLPRRSFFSVCFSNSSSARGARS